MPEALALSAPRRATAVLGEASAAWFLVAPAGIALFLLLLGPSAALLALSFSDWELGAPTLAWIGFENYAELATDPVFRAALSNTLVYVRVVMPASIGLGLGVALLIESGTRLRAFFRAVYFLPVVSLLVAMATAWQYLLHPTIGPVNKLLAMVGIAPVNWLGSSDWVMVSLCMIGVWENLGFVVVLFLAGLTAIPADLYAAAETDGARSGLDRFRLVTWPLLGPTTLFVVTITAIRCLRVFDTVAALTRGGPNNASEVLLHMMYREGFSYFRIGYSAAITVVFLVIVLALMLVQTRLLDRQVHYG
ncbi:carbohydrate ABC transporter permease [Plastoroseomonas arctica]|uniref:Sugar ABC transporter permease n=1 Tax=Plastoroseomonas arctica TaxID=1509237 RepID=A0AAF1KN19_9PROT|nr:sugar ABC transporter permease [Plastoroseomonas arctica]MBR0656129.1 sugar ABC transporter permease [Plastoroseomonas arctica]